MDYMLQVAPTQHRVTNYRSFISFSNGNPHGKNHQKDRRYMSFANVSMVDALDLGLLSEGMGISELLFLGKVGVCAYWGMCGN